MLIICSDIGGSIRLALRLSPAIYGRKDGNGKGVDRQPAAGMIPAR
jgi:hypothetical protein